MYRSKLSPTFGSLIMGISVMLLWIGGCGTEVDGRGELEERVRVSAALSSATDQDIAGGGGLPLAKITLTMDAGAGAQNSSSGRQVRVSSSHPAFLVGVERGAALADGEIAVEETEGVSTTVVTLSFGAGQPAMSGPVAELTYQIQEGGLGDSRLDCFVQPRGESPGSSLLECSLSMAFGELPIRLQDDPGVRGLRGVSPAALDDGRIVPQDDPGVTRLRSGSSTALDGGRLLPQDDPGVTRLRSGSSAALDGGRIRLQDDPDPKFDR